MRNTTGNVGKGETSSQSKEVDPTLFVTSYKKRRFYLFTRRNPPHNVNKNISRDIFNEKPSREELVLAQSTTKGDTLSNKVVICTTMGDIFIKLFPEETPKTCENFLTQCKNGYYDNLIFHRVIKGFMIQTGCPYGDGTGGDSIWGSDFEDEFNKLLRHDKAFTVSMANRGPNTNRSQFFITTVPTVTLDNIHTVFGRVYKGSENILDVENVKTDEYDKPLMDVRILCVRIL